MPHTRLSPFHPAHISADVRMFLHVGDESLQEVQTSSTAIKLKEHRTLEVGPAVLEVIIDGKTRRSEILRRDVGSQHSVVYLPSNHKIPHSRQRSWRFALHWP